MHLRALQCVALASFYALREPRRRQRGATFGNLSTSFAFATTLSEQLSTYRSLTDFHFKPCIRGLTSTEAQNLYNAVAALRTSLGGGNP